MPRCLVLRGPFNDRSPRYPQAPETTIIIAVRWAFILIVLVGCEEQNRPAPRIGGEQAAAGSPALAQELAAGARVAPLAPPPTAPPRADRTPSSVAPLAAAPPAAESDSDSDLEPTRDLEEELRTRFGGGGACLGPGSLPSGRGTIRVSVVVSSSGRVTRAEVSGAPDSSVERCLVSRAQALTFRGPVEGAPHQVAASIEVTAPRARATATGPRDYELPQGARAPGTALPAQVGDGPAPGHVRAGSTLPALGPNERPQGFVAPASTLPALGDPRPTHGPWPFPERQSPPANAP